MERSGGGGVHRWRHGLVWRYASGNKEAGHGGSFPRLKAEFIRFVREATEISGGEQFTPPPAYTGAEITPPLDKAEVIHTKGVAVRDSAPTSQILEQDLPPEGHLRSLPTAYQAIASQYAHQPQLVPRLVGVDRLGHPESHAGRDDHLLLG
ncbi:hypothetical protein NDU88_008215 [Pleurodeles waltl]|uniref:Uncharacterized protein n=1 Tax=Pleurodeles waltl TaxID=8319 RepID=A0AAV7QR57_PLEWA|nr:hypothetical protein NDU88_008215 [Pleurodeles waltl]